VTDTVTDLVNIRRGVTYLLGVIQYEWKVQN